MVYCIQLVDHVHNPLINTPLILVTNIMLKCACKHCAPNEWVNRIFFFSVSWKIAKKHTQQPISSVFFSLVPSLREEAKKKKKKIQRPESLGNDLLNVIRSFFTNNGWISKHELLIFVLFYNVVLFFCGFSINGCNYTMHVQQPPQQRTKTKINWKIC